MDLKEALKGRLNSKELGILHRAYDVVGSIAIIDIPGELKKKEKLIASEVLKSHKSIKTVLKKSGRVKGRLRTRKLNWLAGEKTKETIHVESGCRFKLNVETCYFSPRLSGDRLEIARQVNPGEKVLCMFSGVGPYPVVIAKNSRAAKVYAVEINREASRYAQENVRRNKLGNVEVVQGDAKRIIPRLVKKVGKFDRIFMGRPNLKETFLKEAFIASKKGTVIHMHDFVADEEIPKSTIDKIEEAIARRKSSPKHFKFLKWKRAGEIAPHRSRIRVDFRMI